MQGSWKAKSIQFINITYTYKRIKKFLRCQNVNPHLKTEKNQSDQNYEWKKFQNHTQQNQLKLRGTTQNWGNTNKITHEICMIMIVMAMISAANIVSVISISWLYAKYY